MVQDNGWFFDTELLVLAERSGMRIHEVPVDWTDDPDSRVDIVQTAIADLRGIARLTRDLARGRIPLRPHRYENASGSLGAQLFRFCGVGIASTIAYVVLFLVARTTMSAAWANAIALLITAIGNTAVNRSITFGVRGRTARAAASAARTCGLRRRPRVEHGRTRRQCTQSHRTPGDRSKSSTLVLANLAATILRFLLFRSWVFRRPSDAQNSQRPRATTTTVKEFS